MNFWRKHRTGLSVVAAVVVLVVALVLIIAGQVKIDSAEQFNQAQQSKEAQLPSAVSPSVTPSSVASPSSTQVTTSATTVSTIATTPPAPPLIQEVAPAAPESLRVVTVAGDLDLTVKVDSMGYNPGLQAPSCTNSPDPECPEKAYWVRDTMGTAPASSTDNSTYIVGHSWTPSPRVFDQLSNYAMTHYETVEKGSVDCDTDTTAIGERCPKVTPMASVYDPSGESQQITAWKVPSLVGATITLVTSNGTLTYRVTTAFVAKKVDIGFIHAFQYGDPNTVTLQTCGIDLLNKTDTEFGVAVIGTLESAVANS